MPATVSVPQDDVVERTEGPDTSLPDEGCGADRISSFIDRPATDTTREAIAEAVGHERIRWVGPESIVTMDLRADRLNVMLDGSGVIVGAKCQ